MGEHTIWYTEGTEQYMPIDDIYTHESFDYFTLDYDIMLMKLKYPVTVDEYVKPIALPKACSTPGDMCTASGWGQTFPGQGKAHLILTKKVLKNWLAFGNILRIFSQTMVNLKNIVKTFHRYEDIWTKAFNN